MDHRGKPISLFESGAIMLYLAGKTGRFLGSSERDRYEVLQWLMFQMGGFGPMLGQATTSALRPEPIGYAIDRYTKEAKRLYGVLETRLASSPSWLRALHHCRHRLLGLAASHANQGVDLSDFHR